MKRTVPLLITAIAGFVLIIAFFIPAYQGWGEDTAVWFDILAAIAFLLGGGNLMKVHLKKISDRRQGWGYSGITLIAFLATLIIGLTKVGTTPAANGEFYGESFTPLPLSALPEFRMPGTIPNRADGAPLPDSVRHQMRQEGDEVVFRGWMRPNQEDDLKGYEDTLEWQCLVETLSETAQPPEQLRRDVSYYADHGSLAFRGLMSDEQRDALENLFTDSEVGRQAVARLDEASHRESSVTVSEVPAGFAVPEPFADLVSLDGNQLTLLGPMSTRVRDNLAQKWPAFPRCDRCRTHKSSG